MSRNPATPQDNRQRSRSSTKARAASIRKAATPRPQGVDGAHGRSGSLQAFHLQHIERLLGKVLLFARPADAVVSYYFRENAKLGHRDRGIIAEAIYAVLRRRVEVGQFAESGTGAATRRLGLLGLAATLESRCPEPVPLPG